MAFCQAPIGRLAFPGLSFASPASTSVCEFHEFIFGPFLRPASLNPVRAPGASAVLLPPAAGRVDWDARSPAVFQIDAGDRYPRSFAPGVQISRPGSAEGEDYSSGSP